MSSDATAALEQLLDDYNQKLNNVMPQAVAFNVGLFSAISLGTILVFNFLRPRNKIIYQPKTKYYEGEKRPPRINDGFFSWVSPLIHTKEPELMEKVGLDAVAFLRFLRMMRWLFSGVALLGCAVLIPIDITWNIKNVTSKNRNFLSQMTIQDVSDWPLYVHIAATYIFTIMTLGFIWWHWKAMVQLRHQWFNSPEYTQSFYARTLMILQVPKKIQTDEGLQSLLASLQIPYPTTDVHIGRRVGKLPELVEYHNQAVRDLEAVLVRYLKDGTIGKKRPTITIGGFLGMGGEKKDAIDFYTAKLQKTEAAVEEWRERIDLRKAENYGFASMAAVPYAHAVAKLLSKKSPKGTEISLAPNPKDLIWSNLTMSDAARARNRTVGWFWLAFICFINTIPLLLISLLANLAAVSQYVDFLDAWSNASPTVFSLASGILPPTVSALFGYILPKVMRKLSKFQGAVTKSRLDRAVIARYFAFLIISQLFIFSLIGVGFQFGASIALLIKNHTDKSKIFRELLKLPGSIQRTYIQQASYWLTFFPLRGFLAIFDLAQVINLVIIWIKTKLFGRTPRDIREWTQPPAFEYAVYYSNMLFMVGVALVYAPLAPLVPLAAAIVFWVSSWVYKYQLMFVFITKVESGGRLWNIVMNRVLVCLFLMHALMTLTLGLQLGWGTFRWAAGLPPALIVILFKIYLLRFQNSFMYLTPNEANMNNFKVHSAQTDTKRGRLEKRFGHPALYAELFTPLLHANMMPLLPQVYHGRLGQSEAKLAEYGGQKVEAQVAPGGIKIAGIAQADLEYDLAMYQRDRGEQDWETRSVGSSVMLDNASHPGHPAKPAGYDAYMSQGPTYSRGPQDDIEMARFDSAQDHTPLLPPHGGFGTQQNPSQLSVATDRTGGTSYSNAQPVYPADTYSQGYNQVPQRSYTPSRQQTGTPDMGGRPPVSRQGTYDQYPPAPQRQQTNYDQYQQSHAYNTPPQSYHTHDPNQYQQYQQGNGSRPPSRGW